MNRELIEPSDPRLTAYAVGEMSPDEVAAFEAQLERSPAAWSEIERIRETADLLRCEFGAELKTAFQRQNAPVESSLALVDADPETPAPNRLAFPEMRTVIAAVAAVLVGLAAVSVSWWKNGSGGGKAVDPAVEIAVADNEAEFDANGVAESGIENEVEHSSTDILNDWSVSESRVAAIVSSAPPPAFYLASAEADELIEGTRGFLGSDPVLVQARTLGEDPVDSRPIFIPQNAASAIPAAAGSFSGREIASAQSGPPFGYQIQGLDPEVLKPRNYLEIVGQVIGNGDGQETKSLYVVGKTTDQNGESSVRIQGRVHVEDKGSPVIEDQKAPSVGRDEAGSGAAERYVTRLQERVHKADEAALRGSQLLGDGDYQGSIAEMQAALDLLPNAPLTENRKKAYTTQFAAGSVYLAQQRADEAEYEEARDLLEGVLAPGLDPDNFAAKQLLERLDDPAFYSPATTPDHLQRVRTVEAAHKKAQGYIAIGDFDNAEREYWAVLNEDAYNAAARRSLDEVERHRMNYYERSRNQTRAEFLSRVAEGWELPVPASIASGAASNDTLETRGAFGSGSVVDPNAAAVATVPVENYAGSTLPQSGGLDAGLTMNHAAAGLVNSPESPGLFGWNDAAPAPPSTTVSGRGKFARTFDNPFKDPLDTALSTFSVDVDTASFTAVRRMILKDSQLPHRDQVRIEEFINYFKYDSYETPNLEQVVGNGEVPFSVNLECVSAPWNPANRIVRIGLKGADITAGERPPANLVFLLDVSGSMSSQDKLPLMQKCLRELVPQLRKDDRVTMVVYASKAGEVLEPTPGSDRKTILSAVDALTAKGSTNGEGGIRIAYQRAGENFIEGGVNRILLATDGDFNVGEDSDEALVELIEKQAKSGIELTVLGFGTGNLNDSMLEKITNKGNGQFHYIDRIEEGRRVLVEEINSSLVTIAKDVKIQVEFNAGKVAAYRLIGYANRIMPREHFDDDSKDAGEIGAGHSVTALYEVVPVEALMQMTEAEPVDDLKYKKRAQDEEGEILSPFEQRRRALKKRGIDLFNSPEMLTVKLRYKQPDAEESEKLEMPLIDPKKEFTDASADFRFATAVGAFGEWLRNESAGQAQRTSHQLEKIARIANGAIDGDEFGRKQEFVEMVRAAAELNGGRILLNEDEDEADPVAPAEAGVEKSVQEKLEQLR